MGCGGPEYWLNPLGHNAFFFFQAVLGAEVLSALPLVLFKYSNQSQTYSLFWLLALFPQCDSLCAIFCMKKLPRFHFQTNLKLFYCLLFAHLSSVCFIAQTLEIQSFQFLETSPPAWIALPPF